MLAEWKWKPDFIYAIDPGPEMSAYCLVSYGTLEPLKFGKIGNQELLKDLPIEYLTKIVIEKITSYGMPVGDTVFDTCIWIGRFMEATRLYSDDKPRVDFIARKEEKMAICGSMKANDATIRRALIDRFARFDKKTGKGTKKNPDFFYGFKADIWQAFAVAVTWKEKWEQEG